MFVLIALRFSFPLGSHLGFHMGRIQDLMSVFVQQIDLIEVTNTIAVAGDGAVSLGSLRFQRKVGHSSRKESNHPFELEHLATTTWQTRASS